MTVRVQLTLQGAFDQLRMVWQTGEQLLEMVPFQEDPDGQRHSVLVALQEILTNILRHAHAGEEDLPIRVEFRVDPVGIEIVIEDQGPNFDPSGFELPRMEEHAMPMEPGGFGILIARMVMDHLEHRRIDGRNVLVMSKRAAPIEVAPRRPETGA